ncbi:MAG: UvrABC system protein A [Bacteroidia bacterium]|nr:MAG: UvrABC system protein A [Bacteroidia bacterium]
MEFDCIEVIGAREHNLKNIDVSIPRDQLVVITGVSGSGKSSLIFDTIYAEGQRRYIETFSNYVRQFIGDLERPDVDKVNGLSPVIAIDQKTTNKNPRSTVGTVTDIYDFFRLLYARIGEAYSYVSGKKMEQLSVNEILNRILSHYKNRKIVILAPIVRGRKGHYREELRKILQMGYQARIDKVIMDIKPGMSLERYKVHDIEAVIDKVEVTEENASRIDKSLQLALKLGKKTVIIYDEKSKEDKLFSLALMDPDSDLSYSPPDPNTFSFNSPYGQCPKCLGLGMFYDISIEQILTHPEKSLLNGAIPLISENEDLEYILDNVKAFCKEQKIDIKKPFQSYPKNIQDLLIHGEEEITLEEENEEISLMEIILANLYRYKGIKNYLIQSYNEGSSSVQSVIEPFIKLINCPSCNGARLKKESLFFKIDNKNIHEACSQDLEQLLDWVNSLPSKLTTSQNLIAKELIKEIKQRIEFLIQVGLGYLNLQRPSSTLSGGESQRIRLATQIGTQLTGVTYILDEPSIGLHQRDNFKLIDSLKSLRDLGNSVLVVEHDKDMMLQSDYIIDIGPGAGTHGGHIVGKGKPQDFIQIQGNITADYLANRRSIVVPSKRRKVNPEKKLIIEGAKGHNLKNITVEIPLGLLVCVTGVSGSGKSSLIRHTLYPILHQHVYNFYKETLPYDKVYGLEHIDKVIEVDQSPIGRTPRSNPATYTGLFTLIRNLFTELPESKIRGYAPGRFSFNVRGGRCETCKGAGIQIIEMNFLPDVHVPCPDCRGKRYNRETLEVRYKGKSINDVLEMTIENAIHFFENQPSIRKKLEILNEVGLGYLTIGQSSTTLSGGEAQRMKIATELSKKDTGKTFYILDEPTTGLHFQDIDKLIQILNKLVGKGNTVLVIEHNLDIIKMADYVIDMGPEGGSKGGEIVACGTPEEIANTENSYTGKYLKLELEQSVYSC